MAEEPDILEEYHTEMVDDFMLPSPPRRATVEDDDEEDDEITYRNNKLDRYIEPYPGEAGQGMRTSKTRFEEWLRQQEIEGKKPWEPFASKEEWDLTRWLIKNVGQKSTDDFLKLPIVSEVYR
jgi:hypothetical protein